MIREEFFNETLLLLIGGLITLIATIILYFLQQIILRYIKRRGKISIYYKHVYDSVDSRPASFHKNGKQSLTVPLWLEIHNNKEVNQVVRNVNLALYDSDEIIDKATQVNVIKQGEDKKYLGNNGSYSFNLPPESIHQYEVYYIFDQSDINQNFDSVYLTYYTSKDRMNKSKILEVADGWQTNKLELDGDWIESN